MDKDINKVETRRIKHLEDLMFKEDIKEHLHMGETTFMKWVRDPDVKCFKVARRWAIYPKDLYEWERIQMENK